MLLVDLYGFPFGEKGMRTYRDVSFLVTQSHRSNETLIFHWSTSEVGTDKGWFGDHSLPTLLSCFLSRLYNFEHPNPRVLVSVSTTMSSSSDIPTENPCCKCTDGDSLLLSDTPNLGQRHGKLSRLLLPLILDCTRQSLCVRRLTPIQQIPWQWRTGRFVRSSTLDIAFFMRTYRLLHLYLLLTTCGLHELGA